MRAVARVGRAATGRPPPRPPARRVTAAATPTLDVALETSRVALRRPGLGPPVSLAVVQPASVDAVLDWYVSRGTLGLDPYWARPWPSAVALAEELLSRPELVRGKRVADLGCGLGLPGLTAALLGATEVVMLDRESLALKCAMLSARAAGVAVGTDSGNDSGNDSGRDSSGRDWGRDDPPPPAAPEGPRRDGAATGVVGSAAAVGDDGLPGGGVMTVAEFDWGCLDPGLRPFDVVLAADVLYEPQSVPLVARVVGRLLRRGRGGGAGVSLQVAMAAGAAGAARAALLRRAAGGGGGSDDVMTDVMSDVMTDAGDGGESRGPWAARLLMADPPARCPDNRARFVALAAHGGMKLERERTAVSARDAQGAVDYVRLLQFAMS